MKIPTRADDSKLSAGEITEFRSALGALPWITATRLDVISDVSLLQARVTMAEIRDLKTANLVIEKVKQFADAGLHYRYFETENQRTVCVHDASSSPKGRHYAQEGVLVMTADDMAGDIEPPSMRRPSPMKPSLDTVGLNLLVLCAQGSKAKG